MLCLSKKIKGNGIVSLFTQFVCILLILSLTSGFALLFTSNRRLFIMLSFAHFLNDTVTRCLALEATNCAVKRLIIFNSNLAH